MFLTLHEFECFNILRKMALASYALGGNRIILTNDYERGVFNRYFPFSSSKTETIPIGTNIAPPATVNPARRNRLIYFGQIRAEKGVEFFVETVKTLRASGNEMEAAVIGGVVDKDLGRVVEKAAKEYRLDFLFWAVILVMCRQSYRTLAYALLPFPDGISESGVRPLAASRMG